MGPLLFVKLDGHKGRRPFLGDRGPLPLPEEVGPPLPSNKGIPGCPALQGASWKQEQKHL